LCFSKSVIIFLKDKTAQSLATESKLVSWLFAKAQKVINCRIAVH